MKDKQWLLDVLRSKKESLESEPFRELRRIAKGISQSIELVEQLEEPQKPVVPQFVADWFEENKRDLEYEIYNVISEISSKDTSDQSKIEKWFDANIWDGKNNYPIETAIRMQDGYTVEQEIKVRLKLGGFYFETFDENRAVFVDDSIGYEAYTQIFSDLEAKDIANTLGVEDIVEYEKVED